MTKILGLDLGTNSLGWAVVEKEKSALSFPNENNYPTKGVVIFPEGVNIEAKTGSIKSRAAERTSYRGARRLKFRRKLRKYHTLLVLAKNNMCPLSVEEVELYKNSNFKSYPDNIEFLNWLKTDEENNINPYYFRDKYARKKYDWENDALMAIELGRAFYHIAQRRGFKSNRLEQSDENTIEDTKENIQDAIDETNNLAGLKEKIDQIFEEFDFDKRKNDELDSTDKKLKSIWNYINRVIANKVKNRDFKDYSEVKKEIDRYINRPENLGAVKGNIKELTGKIENNGFETLGQFFWHLYKLDRSKDENKIRNNYTAREEHYEKEFEFICNTQQIPSSIKTELYKAIFFQRPLKSQKGLVGKCTFEKNKPRCPISRPEFEEFRMLSFINSIKIKTPEDDVLRPLYNEEKELIIPKFFRQKASFKFEDIAKALNKNENFIYFKDRHAKESNYQINFILNTTVPGNPVSTALRSVLGDDWNSKIYKMDTEGRPIYLYELAWHALSTYTDKEKLVEFAEKKLGVDNEKSKKLAKITLQQGYASISLKAINNILPWLKKGLIYSHAVFMANLDTIINEKLWNNPDDRKIIEDNIGEIVDKHNDKKKIICAVNDLIGKYKRDNGGSYSEEAETYYLKDIEKKLKAVFGEKKLNKNNNSEIYIDEALELLKKQLKTDKKQTKFLKIKRLDEAVKEFIDDNGFAKSSEALKKLYHPSALENFKPEISIDKDGNKIKVLPLPKTDAIKNPVLMRAMHQLRKLINTLLTQGVIDADTRIHVEMAREVNDANKRLAYKKWQDSLRDKREKAVSEIKMLYKDECGKDIDPTEDDITRFLLWEEQGRKEIYEKESNNISICDIIGANPKYDIEHTLPRSISWDNSLMNKTLCSKKFNREIKKNKIPAELNNYDDIIQRIEPWKRQYEKLDREIKNINAVKIQDKETKDRLIQKRNLLKLEYDYWKGKHDRFTMKEVPEGFKNSQIVETGLITRFAREYLSCLFKNRSDNSNVYVVNGQAVSEFRKAWGIQDYFVKKSRANHIHHCIDAVTVACMTKDKYDEFVYEWRKVEEQKEKYDVAGRVLISKPWPSFTEDVKQIEDEVFIVHKHKDNIPKHTKKKLRKRGRIIYKDKEKKNPVFVEGDTARASLVQETFYGAIKQGKDLQYVVRKKLDDLADSDIDKIIDQRVKTIVIEGRKKEKELKKQINSFKELLKNADDIREKEIKAEIEKLQYSIENETYVIPPRKGKIKFTPIRKVRIKAKITEPLKNFKKHRDAGLNIDGTPKHPYKNEVYVQNDGNYCLALYESEDRSKRAAEIIKMIEAVDYFKRSNKEHRQNFPFIEEEKNGMKLKGLLKPKTLVLFYKDNPEEIWDLSKNELRKRLYYFRKSAKNGQTTFQFHQEARNDEKLKEDYKNEFGCEPPKSLTNGVAKIEFDKLPISKLLLSPVNMNMLIEGVDFRITQLGEIIRL